VVTCPPTGGDRTGPPGTCRTGGETGLRRRRAIRAVGLALSGILAGCGGDDGPGPGLYASNAQVIHRRGDDRLDYPEDVLVRVTVENTTPDRQNATLRTTLEQLDESGETPAVRGSWTDEREISISRGTSRPYFVLFGDVLGANSTDPGLRARARTV
jgi:hypothetical protein